MKTILVPVDFSSVTETVVAEAASLARSLSARVVFLTAVQPPVVLAEYAPLMQDIAEITAAGEKAATLRLTKLKAKLEAEKIGVETVQVVGAPVQHIAAEAERTGASYIVMGSHGHTALYDLLVGSTTHGVLKRAHCPVVIVPAGKKRG
jgi:nucleotide-binding universal stress UspA family protein